MTISFHCPNGHKIHAPDEFSGRSGQCPKCQAAFEVPSSDEAKAATPGMANVILFQCDNGLKLYAPPKLAGRMGQCPHCGVKFRIPVPGEEDENEDGRNDFDDLED
ncbi:MAG: hypothetical protein N2C14_17530, partial [Planctomycetales bacterium]